MAVEKLQMGSGKFEEFERRILQLDQEVWDLKAIHGMLS